MGKSKFFKGVLYGAVAGGLLTLLDKSTRDEVGTTLKNSGDTITKYSKNPKLLADTSKDVYEKLRTTADQVSKDIQFITEKVNIIKGMTPQVKEMIEETKETFEDSSEAYKETFTEHPPNELTTGEEDSQPVASSFKGY
ncbi:YtxH domain-containing protein [Rossellomorea aquimaris]|uniref:YtxH domain-containing protein n=1 Tax=Rossellomorea aquimaris TaxID=189382 RepID=UPI001CD80D53|nr:YtxH domain-containing protein [Rossellomorea aquimaris]MCA1055935.1 YtxH domain-containing protein [Rossellomorea aquimaris]